jgi:acetyl-CoA synthetase (ADP-forming)
MADIKTKKPLVVTEMVGTEESIGRDFPLLLSSGISVYSDAARAAKALSRLWEYARFRMRLPAAVEEGFGSMREADSTATSGRDVQVMEKALREGRTVLSEHESKEILRAYGIPVTKERETRDAREFREALEEIGFPLVIKAGAPALAHKTEQGLVCLDIRNEQEAVAAFTQITARFKGEKAAILVQEMIRGSRELMVGLYRDEQFGPCVMFGLGGIFTEILKDTTFRVAPIDRQEALDMIGDIKARNIVGAFRGMMAADVDQLADILVKVSAVGLDHPEVKEIDINPVILAGSKPVAVDALIVLSGQDESRSE